MTQHHMAGPIKYRGAIVAIAGPRRVFIAPQIEQLPPDHGLHRAVAIVCLAAWDHDTERYRC